MTSERRRGIIKFLLLYCTLMGAALLDSARKQKMEYIDSHLEMETNTRVRAEMEYMKGEVYKTYRVFGKSLIDIEEQAAGERMKNMSEVECYN